MQEIEAFEVIFTEENILIFSLPFRDGKADRITSYNVCYTKLLRNMREADIAVSYTPPVRSDLVALSKHTMNFALFASHKYIMKHGTPSSLKDIQDNHLICDRTEYIEDWDKWRKTLEKSDKVRNNFV